MSSPAPPTDDPIERVARTRFGLASVHPWQREAMEALLGEPGKVLVVAPTGGGKSLCFQLPALLLEGTTYVVSPLISLMDDQVRGLDARGIPATYLASTLDAAARAERWRGIWAGRYRLVYLAPERLADERFVERLAESPVAALVVDEAHCIVQWGHDFRPDYLRIGELIERLAPRRVLACTATATPAARDEIVAKMRLDPASTHVVLRGFARPNLALDVAEVDGPREAASCTDEALVEALVSRKAPRGTSIVYAATRRTTEALAGKLGALGWGARAYHAGLPSAERNDVQGAFAEGRLPVVVATNAFGMGIDRPDVRVVVHAQPSASLEAYYQEVGRAGRDGAPARGLLLVAPGDVAVRRRLCEMGPDGGEAGAAQAARAWALFRELLRYVDANSCRHDFILRYFGDEAESLGGCGRCDVCRAIDAGERDDPAAEARAALVVRQALAGVARARRRGGMQAVAEMLRGEASERVTRFGFDTLSTFGLLSGRSQDDLMALLRALLAAGFVDLTPGEFPIPFVTDPGARVMRGEDPPHMRLPRARRAPGKTPRARAKARAARVVSDDAAPVDDALLEALRVHRAAVAREAGVPAYVVAHDRTLVEIAARRPTTLDELEGVHGLGPAKIARYGEGFVAVSVRAQGG